MKNKREILRKMRMSKVLLIVVMLLCFTKITYAQNNEKKSKLSYKCIIEGTFAEGVEFYYNDQGSGYNEKKSDSWLFDLRVGLDIINNMVFNKNLLIGIGIGLDYRPLGEIGGIAFFNVRKYFKDKKNTFQPMLNASIGTRITTPIKGMLYGFFGNTYYYEKSLSIGAYATLDGGFRYKHFSFSVGAVFWSNKVAVAIEPIVKLGAIF